MAWAPGEGKRVMDLPPRKARPRPIEAHLALTPPPLVSIVGLTA